MDRNIVYPGEIPLDTDFLGVQRNVMLGLGWLAQATLGQNPVAAGLACNPTTPASMSITIGAGALTSLSVVDQNPFGSLAADPTDPLLKMGINKSAKPFTLTAPGTSGQTQVYVIAAAFAETFSGTAVLPYVNAANPQQPFSGPGNDGAGQFTTITQTVTLQMVVGTPGTPGSVPALPAGYIGLYLITLTSGQTSITGDNIAVYPNAPFVQSLGMIQHGLQNMVVVSAAGSGTGNGTSGTWTCPNNVRVIEVSGVGAGGNGGAYSGNNGQGGGPGRGFTAFVGVSPGATYPYYVPASGGDTTPLTFGSFISATKGHDGLAGNIAYGSGGDPQAGNSGYVTFSGVISAVNWLGTPADKPQSGSPSGTPYSGIGGAPTGPFAAAPLLPGAGLNAAFNIGPGLGGAGGTSLNGGGNGAPGLLLIKY